MKPQSPVPARVARGRIFYGYVVAGAGLCIWLVAWGIYQSFGVFYKPLLTEFGWSRAETVLAYSLVSIVSAVMAIVMGWLTDRFGPRLVLTVFGSFLGIAYLLMSRITTLWQFHADHVLVAIGLSTTSTPIMATIPRWFVRRRGLMTGIVQAGACVGVFICAPLAGYLILTHDWRFAYATLGAVALASIFLSGLLMRRDPRDVGQLPDGARAVAAMPDKDPGPSVQTTGLSLSAAARTGRFWAMAAVYFVFGFCRSTFLPHIPAHVQDLGFSLTDGANVVAVLTLSSVLGRLGTGPLGNIPAFMASFAVTAAAMVLGLVTTSLPGLYLFGVIFGIGWGAQAVLRFTVAADAFGLASLGLIMGVLAFAEAGAAALGSYAAGLMFDVAGSYQPAFAMGIAMSITGIILSFVLGRLIKRDGERSVGPAS